MKRIVMFSGGVETLTYFSKEMAKEFDLGKEYEEAEVNRIIEKFHEDLNAGSLPLLKEEYSISSLINRIEDNTINNYEF